MTHPAPFQDSAFSWVAQFPPSRNQFVSFQLDVDYQNEEAVSLHLFADTRYRLFVNEVFCAYGPARFVTQFAEYDSFDLTPLLSRGPNRIRVEVNYYGASSYQSMPDGLPGFIAAGGTPDDSLSFATPGNWRARIHKAWNPQAPLFSFAQNPVEILDTRQLQKELEASETHPVRALPSAQSPWTTLRPRSAPYPDYHPGIPKKILLAAPGSSTFHRIGVQLVEPHFDRKISTTKRRQITSWIHSPSAQTLLFESFWSEVEINGVPCPLDDSTIQGNHGYLTFLLKAGWNFYSANIEQLTEHWSHLLGWPADAKLSLHARPDLGESAPWALSPPLDRHEIMPVPASLPGAQLPPGWTRDSGDISRISPGRFVAWMRPDDARARKEIPWEDLSEVQLIHAVTAIWTLDFQDQFYGHPLIEVEAPAGSILEVAYDDWKRPDGCVNLYNSNAFTDATDRYILKGGRQAVEVLNPRGGIYLQVVLRSPDASVVPLRLHQVCIRSRQVLKQNPSESSFRCGDPVMDWAWATSTHTLRASTDEAYVDCPWRERGSYIGDTLVNLHLHRLISPDLSIARRTLRMMGEGQHSEGPRKGQLASVTPAWHRYGHDDFTLIWILGLRDYWRLSGDRSLLEETRPVIQRIWESPAWKVNDAGLWDITPDMSPFFDWGLQPIDRTGNSNLILNLFRLGALQATAEIETVLGGDPTSTRIQIDSLRQAIQTRLWMEDQDRFAPSDDHISPCLHGQVLALAFGAGDPERILKRIEPELLRNLEQGITHGQDSGHLELYFHFYLLPVLAEMGRGDLAETFITSHFHFLKNLGFPTLNEGFCRAREGNGSCCHSWGGAPAIYATQNILGLRQKEPGNPDAWIVDPRTPTYTAASGTLPHAKGPIRVSWTRRDDRFDIQIHAPEGVDVSPVTETALSHPPNAYAKVY